MNPSTSKFPTSRKAIIGIGLLFGLLHVGIFLWSSTGAGHGYNPFAIFVGPVFFGAGSLLWFILPPLQYALYADVAYRRDRKQGLRLAAFHYGSGLLAFAFYVMKGESNGKNSSIDFNTVLLDTVLTYFIFMFLNLVFFRRILRHQT
jgi:hypothetical protein